MGEIVSATDDITVMDMEASLEHLSRGTVRHVDVLLIVTEPYYRALETARRTLPLARKLGINNIYAIVNKYRSDADRQIVTDFCQNNELEIIAHIPFDENVTKADVEGKSLIDYNPAAPLVEEVGRLTAALRQRVPLNNSAASKVLTKPNC